MRIALRHRAGLVPEQTLDFVQIDSPLHESRRERVPHTYLVRSKAECRVSFC